MHTAWLREHNRLAGRLASLNPGWVGEKVFQEARRLLVAQWQHIVYNEWLPILLGREYMTSFNLLPTSDSYTNDYDEVASTIINDQGFVERSFTG